MDRDKLKIIIGTGIGLLLVIGVLSVILGDSVQPVYRRTLVAQNTIVEISSMAASDANNVSTRTLAARIASTTGSDRSNLMEVYQTQYGESVDAAEETRIEELDNATENYDGMYRDMVLQYLRQSQNRMDILQQSFTNRRLNAIINQARSNHETYIQTLSQNAS